MFNTREVYNTHFGVNNLASSDSWVFGLRTWFSDIFTEHYAFSTITSQGQLEIHCYGHVPNKNAHNYRLLR